MLSFFSNIFGFVLNIIYNLIKNYGLAIILFSIIIKIVLLPISIKQQRTMKKTEKIQKELKNIQDKYKNQPEKLNQEMMDLYKKENMSPFSGCLSAIVQLILFIAVFLLVKSPLTYMKKLDSTVIENYKNTMEQNGASVSTSYPEISIIRDVRNNGLTDSDLYINMNFLGLDLSEIPQENFGDFKVYIIPVLYVISSIISMKITSNMTNKKSKEDIVENTEEKALKPEENDINMADQMNKTMTWMMPIMSVTISLVAPLGLALYWLINNILMILERIVINNFVLKKEDKKNA